MVIAAAVLALVASACSIDPTAGVRAITVAVDPAASAAPESFGLPFSGPTLASHWHAAYVVRVCDEVLDPFTDENDPLGIHTHGDGLIHIHPFFPESAFEEATIGQFIDALGLGMEDGYLEIPGVGVWRDGDMCGDEPGELSIQRWATPEAIEPYEAHTEDLRGTRFITDGEMFTITFAPADALPTRPPSADLLYGASPRLQYGDPEPSVVMPLDPEPDSFAIWPIAAIGEQPCGSDQVKQRGSSANALCFDRGEPIFDGTNLVGAEAFMVGKDPGVVIDVEPQVIEELNALIIPLMDAGGIQIAIELNGSVIVGAAAGRPFEQDRITIAGGMHADTAKALADALNAAAG